MRAFVLERDGSRIQVAENGQRLLAVLALSSGRCERAHVAGVLWPEVLDRHALASLRTTVWRLQKSSPGLLDATASDLALAVAVTVDVDERVRLGRELFDRDGSVDAAARLDDYGSELLPGWYDDWILTERERIRQLDLHVLQSVARRLARDQQFGPALEAAWHVVRIDPLRESGHRLLIEIHLAEGNVRDAVRQFELCARLLRRELGVPPTRSLRDLLRHALGEPLPLSSAGGLR